MSRSQRASMAKVKTPGAPSKSGRLKIGLNSGGSILATSRQADLGSPAQRRHFHTFAVPTSSPDFAPRPGRTTSTALVSGPHVYSHRNQQNQTEDDLLVERVQSKQVEPVGDQCDEQHAKDRATHCTLTTRN